MPLWPTVVVSAVFPADADMAGVRNALGATPGLDPLLVAEKSTLEAVADRAWEREWLKDFRPMRFGRRLWVCPGGQRPPVAENPPGRAGDDDAPSLEPVLVELDPGLAFGTGTHATTALCLEWLDSGALHWLDGAQVIDYGCGSGILAVAALKLGARHAVAMDIDPQALIATRENAAQERRRRPGAGHRRPASAGVPPPTCWSPTSSPVRWSNWHRGSPGSCGPADTSPSAACCSSRPMP